MLTVYIDADACPVKDEVYKVAGRYGMRVAVVANSTMRVPANPLVELVVRVGFGAADDYIAEVCGPGDVVITADIPLAARAIAKWSRVLDPRGRELTDGDIGVALAVRDLKDEMRQGGAITGGPPPMGPKDRSRFLATLDNLIVAVRKQFPPAG